MFQQTFVPEVRSGRKPIGIALSLVMQGLLLVLGCLAPLLVSQPAPTAQLRLLFLGPMPPRTPEKSATAVKAAAQTNVIRNSFRQTLAVVIRKPSNTRVEAMPEAPDIAEGTGPNAGTESLLSGFGGSSAVAAPPMREERLEAKSHTGPISIGGNVAAANLIRRVEPVYPPLAKVAHIQGVVIFQATIGIDGQIRDVQLQEGHPLLVPAARSAIMQWRYRPTLLNGKPVEVLTTIMVRFSLAQ